MNNKSKEWATQIEDPKQPANSVKISKIVENESNK